LDRRKVSRKREETPFGSRETIVYEEDDLPALPEDFHPIGGPEIMESPLETLTEHLAAKYGPEVEMELKDRRYVKSFFADFQ
jgi:hypothetical protein